MRILRNVLHIYLWHLWLLLAACFSAAAYGGDFTKYVNPFIGTDGHGHTFPGATTPFGMVQLSPDTRVEGWDACGGYHYSDSIILGFSHTHLSGTGIADYGDILILPLDGNILSKGTRSHFSHARESASPGYYRVFLDDFQIDAELTATPRTGIHRYTFPKTAQPKIVVNLRHGLGPDRVTESYVRVNGLRELVGLRRSSGWAKDQYVYFVAQFSSPISDYVLTGNDSVSLEEGFASGSDVQCHLNFRSVKEQQIVVKVGLSSVSIDGARKNITSEAPAWDFDELKKAASRMWKDELGKIEVDGGSSAQMTTFYTALYHAMIAPNIMSDVDKRYRGMDDSIHTATGFDMYTVFSLWDTFRAEHPLLTLIDTKRTRDFVKSLLQKGRESGILPVWELASNETWTMIGYHSVPVIADAYVKGIRDIDIAGSLEAMTHAAGLDHFGLSEYRKSGFIGGDIEGESVSKTLEYAYDDWCIAEMARIAGNSALTGQFARRSQSYRNLFDASTGFFRPKINGGWIKPFDPASVTVHYTEANPWQYSFFVPHDIDGLIALHGGSARFTARLDSLFEGGSLMAGRQQSDITGLVGQYAQGNEPSHHVAYLYNYAGVPWKTAAVVRRIMDSLYTEKPDGLCGNDDCGQMSAWYVMSAMGFYQVCPGIPQYALGSPLFEKTVIHFENGNEFTIRAEDNSSANKYIQSAELNGDLYLKSYLAHDDMVNGGELELLMAGTPNREWASAGESIPHSPRATDYVAVPYFSSGGRMFADSMRVDIASLDSSNHLYYRVDPGDSGAATAGVNAPAVQAATLLLSQTTSISAWAVNDRNGSSDTVRARFIQHKPVGTMKLGSSYDPQYAGGGDGTLIDGMRGGQNFHLAEWQGYHGVDVEAVIDLGGQKTVSSVGIGALQDNNSWIFFPKQVVFSFSQNGTAWRDSVVVSNSVPPQDMEVTVREFGTTVRDLRTRYVKVRATNMGVCPRWHKGAGDVAWLFVDEIIINLKK